MAPDSSPQTSVTLKPGDKLERYQIIEQIGAGGSSVVWKGYDALLDRNVAVKQMLIGADTEEAAFRQRFRREADMLAKLSEVHPRLVHLFEFIEDERGSFIVMEFVDGDSLEHVLARSGDPLSVRQALRVLAGVGHVLEAIHHRGVVHRDLKPSNILIHGAGGIKLCDLGLASLIAEQEAASLGSVRYMAPELFATDVKADGRADVYALGIIAYEMLVGRTAFNQAFKAVLRDQRNQAMRWMKWHTNMRLSPPSVHELNPDVSPRLSELVMRMIDKDRTRRIGSAAELNQAIQRHFGGKGDAGRPPQGQARGQVDEGRAAPPAGQAPEDTAELPKRKKWPLAVAGVLLLGVLGTGGYFGWQQLEASKAETARVDAGEAQLQQARDHYQNHAYAEARDAYQAVADTWPAETKLGRSARAGVLLTDAMLLLRDRSFAAAKDKLNDLIEMDVVSRQVTYDLLEQAEVGLAFESALQQIDADIDNQQIAKARTELEKWETKPLTPTEEAILRDRRVRLEGQLSVARMEKVIRDAEQLAAAGDLDEAIAKLQTAQSRFGGGRLSEVLDGMVRRSHFEAAMNRGRRASAEGNLAEAVTAYREALSIRADDELEKTLASLQARAAVAEGRRLYEQGDEAGARAAFLRALSFTEDAEARGWLSRIESSSRRETLTQIGDQAMAGRQYERAIAQFQEALKLASDAAVEAELRERISRANHAMYLQQAQQHAAAGELGEAEAAYRQALQFDPQSSTAQRGLENLATEQQYRQRLAAGDAARAQSKFAEATREYRAAREIRNTPEVQQRMDNNEYEHWLARARGHIAAERWEQAQDCLLTAGKLRPTDTVVELLNDVRKHIKPKGNADDTP